MARINERMPPKIAAGFVCGPMFKTNVATRANGVEDRNRDWLYGRFKATASYAAFTTAEQDMLDNIFQATAGMWAAFRFRDISRPARYRVANQLLSPEIGASTPLQVMRTYTWGLTTPRMIQAVDASAFVLNIDGSPYTDFTLDDELGLLTPDTTWPAGVYTWSGRHDLWMRFNSDWHASTAVTQKITTAEIELIEDRQL
jgi:uncharacterized protein (TIGR02217 family)